MPRPHAFEAAVEAGLITPAQGERLAAFYAQDPVGTRASPQASPEAGPPARGARFDLAHVLWYAGALIVMGAMGLFSTLAFAAMGGPALTLTALAYAAGALALGHRLWHRGLRVPGGLLVSVAVAMTPLAVFGVQEATGSWGAAGSPGAYRQYYAVVAGGWLPMELATLAAALAAVRRYPFGLIAGVAALALWFLSMDLAPLLVGRDALDGEARRTVSLWFGLALIGFAWWVDLRQRAADYAFWLHLAGVAAFWGGLSLGQASGEPARLVYLLVNLGLVGLSVFLSRRVYAVFGAIGTSLYLGHLAWDVFEDALLFPFALSLIGLGVVGLGLLYHRHGDALARGLDRRLPPTLRHLRPRGL